MEQSNENPIIILSQMCQKKWGKNIEKDVRNTGTAKEPFVIVHIELPDGTVHSGSGGNKRIAGQAAAMRGLDYMNSLKENRRPVIESIDRKLPPLIIGKRGIADIRNRFKDSGLTLNEVLEKIKPMLDKRYLYQGYCISIKDSRYKIYSISDETKWKLIRTSGVYAKRSGKKLRRYESDDVAFEKALLYIDNFLPEGSL